MLTHLTVERFKSLRIAHIDFGQVNLFIGGNGSGKSNILEAIGVLSAALSRGVSDSDLTRKGVRLTPPELMKSAFKSHDLPKTLHLAATLSDQVDYSIRLTGRQEDPLLAFFSEACTYRSKRVFERSNHGANALGNSLHGHLDRHRSLWDQVHTAYHFPEQVEAALFVLAKYAIFSPQTDFLRGTKVGEINTLPIGLHGEGLPVAVRSVLKRLHKLQLQYRHTNAAQESERVALNLQDTILKLVYLPNWANRFRVGPIKDHLISRGALARGDDMVYFVDQFMHSTMNTLSAYDSSEGTLFLLFTAVLLMHPDAPELFALDNVDNALNPKLTKALLETIIDVTTTSTAFDLDFGPRQVFLTSHNPTSLDAFDLFNDQQRVFVVNRNKNGHTEVTRLEPQAGLTKEDWLQKVEGRKLSQLWLDGEIRGALGMDG